MLSTVNPTGKHRKKRRHHGEGTVIERRDRWRAKPWAAVVPYTDPSGRRREMWLSASSRVEAEALRREKVAEFARRIVPTTHTVGSYVTDWLMSGEFGPATFDRYRHHVQVRILKSFGDLPLAALTPPRVRSALQSWVGSASTRSSTLIVLRAAMRQAVADRMRVDDPTDGVRAPAIHDKAPVVLDVAEARHLLETVKGERLYPVLVASLGLGLRRGECLGLRTPDVDLAARTLTIAKQLRRIPVSARADEAEWWRLVDPKASSARVIPLPTFVADVLAERIAERDRERKASRVYAPNDFVFCDPHGNPIALTSLARWFEDALKRAGLPAMKWHGLRHSTATMLLAEGVPERTVQDILGHSSGEMTRRYMQVLPRMGRDAAERLDKAMGG